MNILAAVIAFVTGFLSSYFAQWPPPPRTLRRMYLSRRRRERECYTMPRGKIYIIPSCSTDEVSWYLSEHDMACADYVAKMLRELGYRDETEFRLYFQDPKQDSVPDAIRTENLILICGPKRNKLVETILRDFPDLLTSIHLDLSDGAAFIWHEQRYTANDTHDYAILAVKHNPYNAKHRVVFLFGLKSIGTKGAGSFYANPGWADARAKAAERLETRGGEIEILLRVGHTQDYRDIKSVVPVAS